MVRRVIGLVYKEISGLHQAAYILAIFAFGSQVLALIRDRILAAQFGADATLDVYYAAFRIPDVLFVLFASTLSVYVLLPFVTKHIVAAQSERAARLLGQVMTLFLLGYTALALVIFFVAPALSSWLFANIAEQELLVAVMRTLLLQPLLLGVSSLFGVVTQYHSRFILHAVSPLLYNLGIIFGIVALYPAFGLVGVASGVVVGAAFHLLVQWPLVQRSSLRFTPILRIDWAEMRSVLRTSIPRALTLSLNQITLLVLFSLGSTMAVGSVAVFQFAYNLQSVPLAIIGVSYSVAAFPTLAKLFADQQLEAFAAHISAALRHIIFWAIPIIALCVILRAQLVRVILGSGAFNWEDTRLTAAVFAILIISLLSHAIHLLLVRALYAGGDTKTPLIVAVVGTTASVLLAVWLHAQYVAHEAFQMAVASTLRVSDVAGTEVLVLAAAYTMGMWLQMVVLIGVTQYRFALPWREPVRVLVHAITAAVAGASAAYVALYFFVAGLNVDTFIGIFIQGALGTLCGVAAIIAVYALVGSPELHEVYQSLSRRIFKTNVVAAQKHVL